MMMDPGSPHSAFTLVARKITYFRSTVQHIPIGTADSYTGSNGDHTLDMWYKHVMLGSHSTHSIHSDIGILYVYF